MVLENLFEAKIRTHPKWGPLVDWVRKADDTFFEWTESLELLDEFHASTHYIQLSNGNLRLKKTIKFHS